MKKEKIKEVHLVDEIGNATIIKNNYFLLYSEGEYIATINDCCDTTFIQEFEKLSVLKIEVKNIEQKLKNLMKEGLM